MQMAMYLINEVLVEGQSVRTVARNHGVPKGWLYELLVRYAEEGESGTPQAPHTGPQPDPPAPRGLKIVRDVSRDTSSDVSRHHSVSYRQTPRHLVIALPGRAPYPRLLTRILHIVVRATM